MYFLKGPTQKVKPKSDEFFLIQGKEMFSRVKKILFSFKNKKKNWI